MAILDIFNRKETYQGYVLSNKVDKELQKRLIEAGRGDEINSFTPDAVKKGNEMMNVTANSTPAFMVGGKNNLDPEPVKMGTVLSDVAKKTEEKIFTSPAVQKGLEKTVGYLDVTREAIQNGGVIRRDDKEILFTDLPITQQIASSAFTALSEGYGRVGLGMIEGFGSALEWQGVDAGKSISEKAKAWQDTALLSYEDMSRGQKVLTSLNNVLASTAYFYMGGNAVMSGVGLLKFSPKLAFLAAEVGSLSSSALEAGIEAGDIYKSSLEKGENIELAEAKANSVFMANMLALYVTNRLGFFNEHIKGEFKRMVFNAPLEGLQEGMQQFFQNQALGNKWYEGVLENFGYGAFAGFLLGGGNSVKDLMEKGNLTPGGKKREELVALPDEFYQVETNEGNKYFETNKEASEFASSLDEGSYVISQKTAEDALKIIEEGNLAAFPFEGKISAMQEQANKLLAEIGEKFNLSKSESVRFFEIFQGLANNAKTEEKPAIVQEAIEQAKLNIGETPRIIEEALAEAKKGVISTKDEIEMPSEVYHQTSIDPGVIQAEGFQFGKNSVFGEAAFFKQTPDQTYGGEQIKINPSDFNLKVFPTIKSEQDFISKQGAKNLAEAVRTEGKFDGFIIPQPETDNNVFAITNKEKLDKILDRQQYISTKEAQDLAESFPFLKELNIPVTAKRAIITESGQLILGKYSRAMIEFVQNPKKTTVPHEAIHAFMDLMLTESEQKAIIEEVKRRYPGKIKDAQAKGSYKGVNVKGYTENQIAEEILAEDMIRYIKTDQAPSNKLKQFYNWFVTQVKNLLGDGKIDSIEKLYEEIQKSPSYARRRQARKKMSSYAKDFSALQKEYAQNPEGLTTKFLENVDVKHREFASYEFLKNLTKSKSLPLKEVERNLIESVLDDQFKGEKKISLEDFRAAVASELMPLQVIESDTYADYGSSQINMDSEGSGYDFNYTTNIYNSPFNHGYTGHFGGDFRNLIKRSDVEIKQVPTTNKWAVVKAGVELTEANLQENVYHIASSEEKANEWIGKRAASNFDAQEKTGWIDIGKNGLFGHTRIWKATDPNSPEYGIRYIAEIQSDSFQNPERLDGISKKIEMLKSDLERGEASFKEKIRINEELAALKMSPEEKSFLNYKNTWHERMIREEIRRAAMEGDTKIRIPTPYTISKIEGYLSEDGQIPENTVVGDEFDYMGDSYTLLETSEYYDGATGIVTRSDNIRTIVDFDTARQEDFDNEMSEMIYEIKNAKTADDINSIADGYFTKEQIKELRGYIKNNEDAEIEGMLEPVINNRIDDRYSDNRSYADYYNDMFGGNEKDSFPLDENRIIILEKTETETLSFGQTEADKENFDYEKDLDSTEQRTVARFYDKQVGRYLAKLRKQNFRIVEDERGFEWYETDIMPEDKSAVEAFQTVAAEKPETRTGEEVAEYLDAIEKEKDEGWETDDHLMGIIKQQNFVLTSVKINDLISKDKNLRDYVVSGENRYATEEGSDPNLPIIVGYWDPGRYEDYGVLDGYNRVLTKSKNGDVYIEAWAADTKEKYQAIPDDRRVELEARPEIDQANKKTAERLVKSETTGKKPTIKQAINVAQGKVKPEVISMKETTLLKKKIRDIARGVKMGRSDMRATMIQAFRSRLGELNDMRKAIINYAEDLNLNDRGRLLPMVANAKTQLDLTKAMLRIDAALSRADKIEQLQEVRKTASLVNKAVKSGRGIAVDYQKRLIEILKDYDLKTPTTKTLNRLKSLKEYVDEHPGFVPDYVVKKLDRLSKKNPSQMTADEIRDLNETLNHMISLGHLKLSLKNKYDERVRLLNLTKLLEHTNNIDPKGDPKDKSFSGKLAKARMMLNVIHSFRVADKIDGTQYYKGKNVALQRLMSSKVNNAELSANVILEEVLGQIRAIKNNWTDKEQAVMEFYLLVEMGAHTQANELATAQGWTEMPAITEEMRTAMDLMRGTFKKSQGMTAAIYEEVENKPFEYVDNYFPLKYERRVGELPEITIGQPFVRSKKTEQGFTMKRMPNVKRTPRTDVFSQFEEAVREHQYYINVQPAIMEINSLVGSEEYRKKAGQIASQWWADYLSAMANRGQLPGIRSNAWLARKRINLSRAILGYKLSSALLQPFAIFDALSYFQFRFGQLAAGELAGHFAATWINPRYAKRVIKKSPSLTLRKGTSGELAIAEMKRGTTIGRRSPGKIYNDLALKPLQYLDLKTAAAVDQAAYKILRRQGLSEAEARAEADMVMNIVSGSSEIADRPMALMSGETMRTIFTFQTFMMNRWGLISHDFIRSGLVKGSFSKKAKALYGLFILALAGGLEDDMRKYFYEMIVGKELKDKFSFWQGAFLSLGESVPIIGQFIKGISMPGSSFSVPLTRVVENFSIGVQQLASDKPETRKKGILRLSENIAIWFGFAGTAQMFDLVEGNMNRNAEKPVETFLDEIELPALPNLEALDLPDLQNLDFPPLPALPVL